MTLGTARWLAFAPLIVVAAVVALVVDARLGLVEGACLALLILACTAALVVVQGKIVGAAREAARRQALEAALQRAVAMAESEDDLLDVGAKAIAQAVPHAPAEILLADESGTEIHLAAVAAKGAPGCPVDNASSCAALRSGQTQRFPRPDALDACPRLRARPSGAKPAACVPLSIMGRTIGVVHAVADEGQPFSNDHIVSLEHIASHVGGRLRMLQMVEALKEQATTDPLTGLPNRRAFEERCRRMLRAGRRAAVAIADLDHFKRLNDTFGHAAGDEALRLFARCLRETFSEREAVVARLGGEEFAVVVPLGSGASVSAAFARARENLAASIARNGAPPFTVSFGVALFPHHGAQLTELLGAADRMLYAAKAEGRDRAAVMGEEPSTHALADAASNERRVPRLSLVPSTRAKKEAAG